jgi:hypothetical protein
MDDEIREGRHWDEWSLVLWGLFILVFVFVAYKTLRSVFRRVEYDPTVGVVMLKTVFDRLNK